jgi:hypothetical protein
MARHELTRPRASTVRKRYVPRTCPAGRATSVMPVIMLREGLLVTLAAVPEASVTANWSSEAEDAVTGWATPLVVKRPQLPPGRSWFPTASKAAAHAAARSYSARPHRWLWPRPCSPATAGPAAIHPGWPACRRRHAGHLTEGLSDPALQRPVIEHVSGHDDDPRIGWPVVTAGELWPDATGLAAPCAGGGRARSASVHSELLAPVRRLPCHKPGPCRGGSRHCGMFRTGHRIR